MVLTLLCFAWIQAPVLFAKAAQIFINELSLRAWIHTEDNKRRTLQVSGILEVALYSRVHKVKISTKEIQNTVD